MNDNTSNGTLDVYQIVTDQIIQHLEGGIVPWRQPWQGGNIPRNMLSKRPYRGINLWLLMALGYPHNLFLTWDQIKELGGSVKRGEKGHVIAYWKMPSKDISGTEQDSRNRVPRLLYYKVFNFQQCSNLPISAVHGENVPANGLAADTGASEDLCESIYLAMPSPPKIIHRGLEAIYNPQNDRISMPRKKSFPNTEGYYTALYRQLVHSTGHENRLSRPSITGMAEFRSEPYSIEELIAEMGAAYLCSLAGILPTRMDDITVYIEGWLQKLRNDKKFIISSGFYAQKAVDYILNRKEQEQVEPEAVGGPGVLEEE